MNTKSMRGIFDFPRLSFYIAYFFVFITPKYLPFLKRETRDFFIERKQIS